MIRKFITGKKARPKITQLIKFHELNKIFHVIEWHWGLPNWNSRVYVLLQLVIPLIIVLTIFDQSSFSFFFASRTYVTYQEKHDNYPLFLSLFLIAKTKKLWNLPYDSRPSLVCVHERTIFFASTMRRISAFRTCDSLKILQRFLRDRAQAACSFEPV